jgi:hypothetical protein
MLRLRRPAEVHGLLSFRGGSGAPTVRGVTELQRWRAASRHAIRFRACRRAARAGAVGIRVIVDEMRHAIVVTP